MQTFKGGPPASATESRRRVNALKSVVLACCLIPSLYCLATLSPWAGILLQPLRFLFHDYEHHGAWPWSAAIAGGASCPVQTEPRNVGHDWQPAKDEHYSRLAIERLIGAVQIPTQSYDDMRSDPFKDPRFDIFAKQHEYIEKTFPRVWSHLEIEKVARFGLIMTYKGTNSKLKPIVFMAHQDVVPVNPSTESQWTYGPFSGHVDSDGWIWGRGTTDCKNTLIGILSAIEQLLSEQYTPERAIVLSFGFDEEISGVRSARPIAERLEQIYGKNGVALILDEGFTGLDQSYGVQFARLGLAEKGAINLDLEVLTPGGHSSVPHGRHTGIGIMSRLLVALEDHPDPPSMDKGHPMLSYLQCAADHGNMSNTLKKRVRDPTKWNALSEDLSQSSEVLRAFLSTTQAIDLVDGGVKVNALPEYTHATINYRIKFDSSVAAHKARIASILEPVVRSANLTFDAYGSNNGTTQQVVRLIHREGSEIEPAPLTPSSGPAYELMSGTIRHVFDRPIVAPSGMVANTDTKWTWNLTHNIYRFLPAQMDKLKNFHTVDERMHVSAHLDVIRFYYKLILNSEGWRAE
ncbi:BQ5605_C044g12172 [Microbotryum silenes-dioicae]|uniref:BQ5605_C044g12172 protein n=1 Tax=Microbotryum silenes-dioicae TaxID=796604 RepID=A0A2X0MTK9_9BASI|nr:BQ5605_C044g12172 [Microbotryum silenes-dioicae]